ncbi:MAG: pyridinium-3,5-biscarboxylic acid mononucleotide synthase [Pseudonocardiales bacterium]|jgi:NCAIR mutase (PurE)-related protein|nr:pyridinium-3,5-biscarboxylic acid mononucleotide synthase [Pseudonocardiales bacterium]MDT4920410.1 pyridinium-3,5-biscarboxylic acid mononucleotide synthase [Pseudonocardiales bacterium]
MTPPQGYADVGFAKLDTDRLARLGVPETVLADGKRPRDTVTALQFLHESTGGRAVLATRCDRPTRDACRSAFGTLADIDELARTVVLGALPAAVGTVCVVSAGTADEPVAREVAVTARVHGSATARVCDVGVAGVHRLLDQVDEIRTADVAVIVAGMDGALPSVVSGLVAIPLIGVPTSTGYGWTMAGLTAFQTMLATCSPGLTVVNVDNGFGAGVAAARIARAVGRTR